MGKLFISYRRGDTQDITGRIYDRLASRFGKERIFMDVDSIPLGMDFRTILTNAMAESDVALIIVGRQWLAAADGSGERRLDNPGDFVRIEVEAALAGNIPVIPILTQGAPMPRESDLPESIASLAYRHGVDLRGDPHFGVDVEQLIMRLTPLLDGALQPSVPASPNQELPSNPLPKVPERLAKLGFRGVNVDGDPAIIPPLISISAGPFLMGSDRTKDSEAQSDETPQHRVSVAAFQIAKYPVTVAEYALAVTAHAVRAPIDAYWNFAHWLAEEHPVVNVSWEDAVAYVTWLSTATGQRGWRLATEAEWEKAARWDVEHGISLIYPWGDDFDRNRCNHAGNPNTSDTMPLKTVPVGSYPANDVRRSSASPYGVEEMAGNVYEWTSSLRKPYPYDPSDSRESQASTERRVIRGGSYESGYYGTRAAYRPSSEWDESTFTTGFRLAYTPDSIMS